jgi:HAE1 family hydrophobic/amphiphilic exporter-1
LFVDFFIRRPIFATVCALLIVLAGAVCIPTLPISLYPTLAPPQVVVTSNYIGANSKDVESAVTTILETSINGVEGMRYMSSTSSNDGTSAITVTFDTGYDLNIAAVDVQNRVASAQGRLPAVVNNTGITITKANSNFVLAVGFISPDKSLSQAFISNYIDVYIKDALKRVPGVGDAIIFGERKYAMRLWLDPSRLAARGLTALDVTNALAEQNVEVAAGQLGQQPSDPKQAFQMAVRAVGRLSDPRQFENIVIKNGANGGGIVLVKDVGRAEIGAETYNFRTPTPWTLTNVAALSSRSSKKPIHLAFRASSLSTRPSSSASPSMKSSGPSARPSSLSSSSSSSSCRTGVRPSSLPSPSRSRLSAPSPSLKSSASASTP